MMSVKPDLIALQEVDHKTSRTEKVDQAKELARLTGMHVVFGAEHRIWWWQVWQRDLVETSHQEFAQSSLAQSRDGGTTRSTHR